MEENVIEKKKNNKKTFFIIILVVVILGISGAALIIFGFSGKEDNFEESSNNLKESTTLSSKTTTRATTTSVVKNDALKNHIVINEYTFNVLDCLGQEYSNFGFSIKLVEIDQKRYLLVDGFGYENYELKYIKNPKTLINFNTALSCDGAQLAVLTEDGTIYKTKAFDIGSYIDSVTSFEKYLLKQSLPNKVKSIYLKKCEAGSDDCMERLEYLYAETIDGKTIEISD